MKGKVNKFQVHFVDYRLYSSDFLKMETEGVQEAIRTII
jgi:hypothetical protein